jgi:hypothetical protein
MKLKGKMIIELIDTITKEKQRVVEENMVTDALNLIFGLNPMAALYQLGSGGSVTSWNGKILPVCPNGIGGILLFESALKEDVSNIYAPSSNQVTGYASNDINTTAVTKRGSLNQTESIALENGYKFVWDFATSQANGIIAAVALTHKYGGIGYYGDNVSKNNNAFLQLRKSQVTLPDSNASMIDYVGAMVELDFEGNCYYSITYSGGTVIVTKVHKCITQAGLLDTLLEDGDYVMEQKVLNPSKFTFISSYYGCFYDGRDGYWYGFSGGRNTGGDADVYWIKISKKDYSFTEGLWKLSNIMLSSFGYARYTGSSNVHSVYSAIRGGYLYAMKNDMTGVYKINLSNSADVTLLELGFKSNFSGGYSTMSGGRYLVTVNDIILASDFYITVDDKVVSTANDSEFFYNIQSPMFQKGCFAFGFGHYGNIVYRDIYLVTPYLATINNLSTAVTKTADKTMKITYTLTQVSD